jgi:hypothetical protein
VPPYFPYILALFAYIALAGFILIAAAGLAVFPKTRPFSKKLAAGMCGSFPGVFLFQILATPAVALMLLAMFASAAVVDPGGTAQAVVIVGFAVLMFGIFCFASSLGFYTGFRVAWEIAAGRSPREFFDKDRLVGPIARFLRRRIPPLRKIL